MSEFEFDHFRESLKSKDSVLKYLLKAAGDVHYPVEIRRAALNFRAVFEKIKYEQMSKKGGMTAVAVHEEITHIRQRLLAHNLGGSELSHVLAVVQEYLRT